MLIVQRLASGWSVAAVAIAQGITPRTVRKWRDRHVAEGEAGLLDRSSRPHRSPARLDSTAEDAIEALRRQRLSGPAIARSAHVIVDATPRNAAENAECLAVRVEKHLVRLQERGTDNESAAVTKLGMRRLQLGPLAADDRPILAPVELGSFPRLKDQWNERAPARVSAALAAVLSSRRGQTRQHGRKNRRT